MATTSDFSVKQYLQPPSRQKSKSKINYSIADLLGFKKTGTAKDILGKPQNVYSPNWGYFYKPSTPKPFGQQNFGEIVGSIRNTYQTTPGASKMPFEQVFKASFPSVTPATKQRAVTNPTYGANTTRQGEPYTPSNDLLGKFPSVGAPPSAYLPPRSPSTGTATTSSATNVPAPTPPSTSVGSSVSKDAVVPSASNTSTGTTKSSAQLQLEQEAANLATYGDARGAGYERSSPIQYDSTVQDFFNRAKSEPSYNEFPRENTTSNLTDLVDSERKRLGVTGTASEIENAENARRQQMADIIGRSYAQQSEDQRRRNQVAEGYARSLNLDLSGGTSNLFSNNNVLETQAIDEGNRELARLDQEKRDAIATNDITYAQRIEDRQNALVSRMSEIEGNVLNRAGLSQNERMNLLGESTARAGLGLEGQRTTATIAQTMANINQMSTSDARDAIKEIRDNYQNFDWMAPAERRALEIKAQLPKGTLDQKGATVGDYQFISGDKYNQSGFFDKTTGKFTPLSDASRGVGEGLGLDVGSLGDYTVAYRNSSDKQAYLNSVGQKVATAILADADNAAMLSDKDVHKEDANLIAQVALEVAANPDVTREEIEKDLIAAGANLAEKDPDKPSNAINRALDAYFPKKSFLSRFF